MLKLLALFVVDVFSEGLDAGILEVVGPGVESDDALEGLDTGTLDLVEPGVTFAVDLVAGVTFAVVTAVDACVTGIGVGCPVIGVPVHVTPSPDMFIPLGQRHV